MVHAQLRVIEVDFSANHVVEKDTIGNFGSPEWRDGRATADQSPGRIEEPVPGRGRMLVAEAVA
jgi:hypothetical protein